MSRCEKCGNRECICGDVERAQVDSLDVLLRIEALLEQLVERQDSPAHVRVRELEELLSSERGCTRVLDAERMRLYEALQEIASGRYIEGASVFAQETLAKCP